MEKKYVYLIIVLVIAATVYLLFFKDEKVSKITDDDIDKISMYINGDDTEYYFINAYHDKGAIAMLNNKDVSHLINVSDNVNQSMPGQYEVIYRISTGTKNIERKRTIYIEELDIDKEFDTEKNRVKLTIKNNNYSYTILPDGIKEESNSFNYTYDKDNNNIFVIYLKSGSKKEYNLNVSNMDMSVPTGTCISEFRNNNTFNVTVDATSKSGIQKYQYNNQDYRNNTFSVSSENSKIIVKVFGNNGSSTDITCKNIYGSDFKTIKANSEKIGNAICNSDVSNANRELEEIIQLYGEKTRSAVAAAALYLTNYEYKIEYQWDGKYLKKGLNPEWGCAKYTMLDRQNKLKCGTIINSGNQTCAAGLDCTGFTSWAFFQAGFDKSVIRTSSQSEDNWGNFNAGKHKYAFSNSNLAYANQIKPGDLAWSEGHVGLVIGVDENTVQIANEPGPIGVTVINKTGGRVSGNWVFTHFVLFDDFYNMYGSNT